MRWVLLLLFLMPPAIQAAEPSSAVSTARVGKDALLLLARHSKDQDARVRAEVARAFGEIGNPAGLKILRRMLKDKNLYVRLEAGHGMLILGDEKGFKAIEDLVRVSTSVAPKKPDPAEELRSIAHDKLRAAAIEKLSIIGGVRSVEILEKTLADRSGAVRDATAVALAKLGFEEFAAPFVDALKSKDEALRAQAAKALWRTGLALGLDGLRAASEDPSPAVRAEAMRALGNFSDSLVLENLSKGLRDNHLPVRSMAVQSVGRIPGPQATRMLREILEQRTFPSVALQAAAGLARRGEKTDIAFIAEALDRPDADLRMQAVEVLQASGEAEAVPLLQAAMAEGDLRVRIRAAAVLVKKLQRPENER